MSKATAFLEPLPILSCSRQKKLSSRYTWSSSSWSAAWRRPTCRRRSSWPSRGRMESRSTWASPEKWKSIESPIWMWDFLFYPEKKIYSKMWKAVHTKSSFFTQTKVLKSLGKPLLAIARFELIIGRKTYLDTPTAKNEQKVFECVTNGSFYARQTVKIGRKYVLNWGF